MSLQDKNTPPAAQDVAVAAAYVLHSPTLQVQRKESLRLIDERISGAVALGVVQRIVSDEPQDVVPDVAKLVDVDPAHVPEALAAFRPLVRNMQVRQLSNTMKHYRALERAAEQTVGRFSLVLEDDSLFGDNVADGIRNTVRCAPEGADVVLMSLPSPKPAPADGEVVFDEALPLFNVLPACDAYLVTPAAAKRLSGAFLPIRFPANVHLTYLIRMLELRVFVAVPNTFVDGSKLGVFPCSLDSNSRLLWNRPYCIMEACVKAPVYGEKEVAEFERALAEQPFKEHPDVLALRAAHLQRIGRTGEAEAMYARAVEALDGNNCIVNNTSDVLRNYIALYKHLQAKPE
jgi:hypothetical protein